MFRVKEDPPRVRGAGQDRVRAFEENAAVTHVKTDPSPRSVMENVRSWRRPCMYESFGRWPYLGRTRGTHQPSNGGCWGVLEHTCGRTAAKRQPVGGQRRSWALHQPASIVIC